MSDSISKIVNNLEKALLSGLKKAFDEYYLLSGEGYWLTHAPEHYIHGVVARHVFKNAGLNVSLEMSPSRINKAVELKSRGQPSKLRNKRFDLVVWNKSSDTVRAVVEIKHSWISKRGDVKKDADKITEYLSQKGRLANTGYLLVYREAKRLSTITEDRIALSDYSGGSCIGQIGSKIPDENGWHWGGFLIRIESSS